MRSVGWACEIFLNHLKVSEHKKDSLNLECDKCKTWTLHKEKYKSVRIQYQKDCSQSEVVVTADLRKVFIIV